MKKNIFIARTFNDNTDYYEASFDYESALANAKAMYSHLTADERKKNTVVVEGYYGIEVPDDDTRSAFELVEQIMRDWDEDKYYNLINGNTDHYEDISRIMEEKNMKEKRKIEVGFQLGDGCEYNGGVNYMLSEDGNLYAEVLLPGEEVKEDYGYMALKNAILKLAEENGVPTEDLVFWYDGQEQYLSDDARLEVEVKSDYRG